MTSRASIKHMAKFFLAERNEAEKLLAAAHRINLPKAIIQWNNRRLQMDEFYKTLVSELEKPRPQ